MITVVIVVVIADGVELIVKNITLNLNYRFLFLDFLFTRHKFLTTLLSYYSLESIYLIHQLMVPPETISEF